MEESATIGYTTMLGRPGDINATSAYIQAIELAAAKQTYGVRAWGFIEPAQTDLLLGRG
jgi:hypothetical protein